MTIDTAVFDVGGVLIEFSPPAYLAERFPDPDERELARQTTFASPLWHAWDRSEFDFDEFLTRLIAAHPEREALIRRAMDGFLSTLREKPETVKRLRALKRAGIRLYVMSNYNARAFADTRRANPFFELFDGFYVSGEQRLGKPDPAAFARLIAMFALDPARTVFIDDNVDNIASAQALGFHTIAFTHPEQIDAFFAGTSEVKP